jgi:uncharacterized protein (TIGR02757 family)
MILKPFLEGITERYHRRELLHTDPLEFVHRYENPYDQEIVGLIASGFAYGNVKQIRGAVENALTRIHAHSSGPSDFVRKWGSAKRSSKTRAPIHSAFDGWVHRFHTGDDLSLLLSLMARTNREYGSLHHLFLEGFEDSLGDALSAQNEKWKAWASESALPRGRSFSHLLSSPSDGSACKRWCMFLRWMVRNDSVDPGTWTKIAEKKSIQTKDLIIPLDTHTGRICRKLGLTNAKVLGWKAAVEVTRNLKAADPDDPVRFDFALCRLGILDLPWESQWC